jgi:hypothetical protein
MRRLFALLTCLATLGGLVIYSQASQAEDRDNKPCTNNTEHCMISAATTYLDALVSHDASHIRLDPNVVRTEQGHNTGTGTAAIIKSVSLRTFDEVIIDRRDTRWFVDKPNHEAVAFYILDIGAPPSRLVPFVRPTVATGTVHLSERFKVDNGLITQIEAIFSINSTTPCEGDGWSPNPGPPPLCLPLGG